MEAEQGGESADATTNPSAVLNQICARFALEHGKKLCSVRLTRHGTAQHTVLPWHGTVQNLFPSNENPQKTKTHIDIFIYPYIHTFKSNIFSATFPEVQKKQQNLRTIKRGSGRQAGKGRGQASRSRWPRQDGRSQTLERFGCCYLSLSLSVSSFSFFLYFCNSFFSAMQTMQI